MRPLLALLLPSIAAAASAPTHAALRKAFEQNKAAIVEVDGPHAHGAGVIVGQSGQVLTSVKFVALYDADVRMGESLYGGKVTMANAAIGAALVEMNGEHRLYAAPVRTAQNLVRGDFLVAIVRGRKDALSPKLTQVTRPVRGKSPFLEISAPLPLGTALFDPQGRLVGIAVKRSRFGMRVLPAPAVKLLLAQRPSP